MEEKKYYKEVGKEDIFFSMDAGLSKEAVCRIMKCKEVEEMSYGQYITACQALSRKSPLSSLKKLQWLLNKKRLRLGYKMPKLTRLKKHGV